MINMSDVQEKPTTSQSFLAKIERQYKAELGESIPWSPLQKTLAQHLYTFLDASIKVLNAKRDQDKQITWDRVNMQKLSLDAVHRISLGLDALIKNHLHVVPYYNKNTGMYDIDLRIGYEGKAYCRPKLAVETPLSVVVELVHETDVFEPFFRDRNNEVESYSFKVTSPFNRGKAIGGFGYIQYEDSRKNRLVIVDQRDLERAEKASQSPDDFWSDKKHREEMQRKTVIHRVYEKIPLDPVKVNAANYEALEAPYVEAIEAEIVDEAHTMALRNVIDIEGREPVQEQLSELPEQQQPVMVGDALEPELVAVQETPKRKPRFGQ